MSGKHRVVVNVNCTINITELLFHGVKETF